MKSRILSTLLLWGLLICIPYYFGVYGALFLILVFTAGTFREVVNMLGKCKIAVEPWGSGSSHILLIMGIAFCSPWLLPPIAWAGLAVAVIILLALLLGDIEDFPSLLQGNLAILAIVGFPFAMTILVIQEWGMLMLIWILAVAKFSDVGALLVGTWLGKHKMTPRLSPKKTWEGLAGGLILATLVGMGFIHLLQDYLPADFTIVHGAWIALPIAIAGVFSDLIESALKRRAGIKDSGKSIPGIGGFFDLTDSIMLSMPLGYALIWIIL